MKSNDLDREFPQGDPQSADCRWCGEVRNNIGLALVCETCD